MIAHKSASRRNQIYLDRKQAATFNQDVPYNPAHNLRTIHDEYAIGPTEIRFPMNPESLDSAFDNSEGTIRALMKGEIK